jgi:4-alpha-glucanotransferase
VEDERAAAAAEQEAVLDLVRERGLLRGAGPAGANVQGTVEALYAYTALAPSLLLGVALVDAVGETRTQNQPGTSTQYPNWRIPLAGPLGPVLLDGLAEYGTFRSLLGTVRTALHPGR